jgi:4-hydroxy 2-oxovalerate aldolase
MKIQLLDCTLRDGGYINNWHFGETAINSIINNLTKAKIDIVESGFLKPVDYNSDYSLYPDSVSVDGFIPNNAYVTMMMEGQYQPENLHSADNSRVKGIRIVFYPERFNEAIQAANFVKSKGYDTYFQPQGTEAYTDKQILDLVESVNKNNYYAVYFVDTFGVAVEDDVKRFAALVDRNLNTGIKIGFHFHNNMQQAFSNARSIVDLNLKHDVILDCSLFGMGRGAGNLPTELIAEYLNINYGSKYNLDYIYSSYTNYIRPLQKYYSWGYTMPHYLASIRGVHPDYANYIIKNGNLNELDISIVMSKIPKESKRKFSKKLIQDILFDFKNNSIDDTESIEEFSNQICNRSILLLAPTKSVITHKDKITEFIVANNPIVITLNHINDYYNVDFSFFTAANRFKNLNFATINSTLLVTSNIKTELKVTTFDFGKLSRVDAEFCDNSLIILLNLLVKSKTRNVYLAGFDGYSSNYNSYYPNDINVKNDDEWNNYMNDFIKSRLKKLSENLNINFVTQSLYDVDTK